MVLFGDKTIAWLDIWSFEHFICGIAWSGLSIYILQTIFTRHHYDPFDKRNHYYFIVFLFMLSYLWESIEFYLEAGYSNVPIVTYWFQGVEFWGNRLIADPICNVSGGIVGLRFRGLVKYARGFNIIWLYTNIIIFPNCMYLQRLIVNYFNPYI